LTLGSITRVSGPKIEGAFRKDAPSSAVFLFDSREDGGKKRADDEVGGVVVEESLVGVIGERGICWTVVFQSRGGFEQVEAASTSREEESSSQG